MGGLMYFAATTANGDRILYKTDGTELGTEAAVTSEVATFPGCDTYSQPPVLNGKLIIDFFVDGEGYDMYATDGTDAGTEMLGDILPGGDSVCDGNCTAQVLFDDHVFFIANDNENDLDNSEIWVTDGTSAGTVKVSDFASSDAVGDDDDASLIVAGDNLFFAVSEWPGDGGDGNLSLYKIGPSGLAETGVDASGSMWAGLGLLVAGVAVVATRRRFVK
jgi:LPXTG-motif cell wall-anchored protein